ncbi:MAG TPA: hypothetical protein DC001_00865 [Clostridiales bacterium]|jgi:hypothetical protein|nr:hypothetical protein [Clostridiales bacterium]HBR09245.1 hypothetical protein [Clostridiales bacterium]
MTAEELLCSLDADPLSRLRWRVLDYFGVLPGGADDTLSDSACLLAAANLVLDLRQNAKREGAGGNPAFDRARFEALKEGRL